MLLLLFVLITDSGCVQVEVVEGVAGEEDHHDDQEEQGEEPAEAEGQHDEHDEDGKDPVIRLIIHERYETRCAGLYTLDCFVNFYCVFPGSDMELDLLAAAETESDSESNHSNQDNASGRRSVVTAATAGSEAGID